jgi:large subunit ribosomal protein L5
MARLLDRYRTEIVPVLRAKTGRQNVLSLPRIEKIVVSMGLGKSRDEAKRVDAAVEDLATLTGQKPVLTKAKKSVSAFRLREGMTIGCKVTLRGARMYEFLDRLVNIAIPRIRDFRGVSNRAFDGRGSYSLGVKEQIIFPEIEYDKIDALRGLDIAINTTAKTDDEARALLTAFRFPFRQEQIKQEPNKQEPNKQEQKG